MGQLMGDRALPCRGIRVVATTSEHDVIADGVGMGIDRASGLGSLAIRKDPDAAEVLPEAALHVAPNDIVERPAAAAADDVLHRRALDRLLVLAEQLGHAGISGTALEVEHGLGPEMSGLACGQGPTYLAGRVVLAVGSCRLRLRQVHRLDVIVVHVDLPGPRWMIPSRCLILLAERLSLIH